MFFGEPEKILIEVKPPDEEGGEPNPPEENPDEKSGEKKADLDESVEEKPVLIPKNFTELDRLSYVVQAIDNDTNVVPVGAFKLTPDHELQRNLYFKGLNKDESSCPEKYYHFRNVQEQEKKELLNRPDSVFHSDVLDSITNDLPKGAWSIQTDAIKTIVKIRSLLWPGYIAYHLPETKNFGGAYFGNGLKNKD